MSALGSAVKALRSAPPGALTGHAVTLTHTLR